MAEYITSTIVNVISTLLLFAFLRIFLTLKHQSLTRKTLIFLASLLLQFLALLYFTSEFYSYAKIILLLMIDVLFCYFLFDCKFFISLVYIILFYLLLGVTDPIAISLCDMAGIIDSSNLNESSSLVLFGITLFSKFLELVLIVVISILKRKRTRINRKNVVLVFPILSVIFYFVIFNLYWQLNDNNIKVLLLVFGGFLLVQNILLILYISMVFSSQNQYAQIKDAYDKQKDFFLAKTAKERAERQMAHDMRNHFVSIMAALNDNDVPYAKEYLATIDEGLENLLPVKVTGNPEVDSLLYYKSTAAKQKGLGLKVRGTLPTDLDISPVELNAVIGNAVDNAIEAADPQKNGTIDIGFKYKEDRLRITVANSYSGTIRKRGDGSFLSSKASGGNGIAIIEQTAHRCGGFVLIDYDSDTFTIEIVLHADR